MTPKVLLDLSGQGRSSITRTHPSIRVRGNLFNWNISDSFQEVSNIDVEALLGKSTA
jgi:hypothetical protein